MDKNYTVVGVLLLAAAFAFLFLQPRPVPEYPQENRERGEDPVLPDPRPGGLMEEADDPGHLGDAVDLPTADADSGGVGDAEVVGPGLVQQGESALASEGAPVEEIYVLENELIRVEFTNLGGGSSTRSGLISKRGSPEHNENCKLARCHRPVTSGPILCYQ